MISKDKLPQKDLLVKILKLVGRYGLPAYLVILLIALVAVCLRAWTVFRVAIVATLPILVGEAVYITVGEVLDD